MTTEIPPALKPIGVNFRIKEVICHHQDDRGFGNAEPYLLTMFFKVDGETAWLTNEFALTGGADFKETPGTHGNLGDTDVKAGDVVPVPSEIGFYKTDLRGIQLPDPCDVLLPGGVSGVVGVVCALLEQDGVTDDAADNGHEAFNFTLKNEINAIVNTLSVDNPEITPEAQDAIADKVTEAFKDAVFAETGLIGDIALVLGSIFFAAGDDPLMDAVFMFKHSELQEKGTIRFNARPNPAATEDWEITGEVSVAESCLAGAIGRLATQADARDIDVTSLRSFRDRQLIPRPQVSEWISLASRNSASIVAPLRRDAKLRSAAVKALAAAAAATKDLNRPVPTEHLATARRVLQSAIADAPPEVRNDLQRLLNVLPQLEGKTPNEILRILSAKGPRPRRRSRPGPGTPSRPQQ